MSLQAISHVQNQRISPERTQVEYLKNVTH